jgi:hypothetical protein
MRIRRRFKTVWLPGLAAIVLSVLWLSALQWASFSGPQILINFDKGQVTLFIPWLWGLVAVGGMAAYWSRRSGGSRGERVFASLFPAFAQLVAFTSALPFLPPWSHPLTGYINRALIPALFLLIGTTPCLNAGRAKTDSHGDYGDRQLKSGGP